MTPMRALAAALAVTAALAGCGYRAAAPYRVRGGVDRVHVNAFENESGDPELGATVTAALRDELARRGAWADGDAPAVLDGSVRASEGAPSTAGGATFRVAVELRARLIVSGKTVQELTVRREADQLGGADALEAEGRRAVVLRRLASDAARELLRAMEAQDAPAAAGR
jgi:hypothetical protein